MFSQRGFIGVSVLVASSTSRSFANLFEPIKHPIPARTYQDASGKKFGIAANGPVWKEPLKDKVLIVDIDTRAPKGPNGLWNHDRMEWESIKLKRKGSAASASFMNHFLYAQIHGYDYRFFNAVDLKDMHNTWIKPHALARFLKSYRFVVLIDADATIQHLEVPLEWLFNRWGVTPRTSIAMPVDVAQVVNGNKHVSEDSKGKMVLNTGFIVAQASPLTFDMMAAWAECPQETRYKGCANWKEKWSHEQRIPCDDAMGYPGRANHPSLLTNCTGQFIRHHTLDKPRTKQSAEIAIVQGLTDIIQLGTPTRQRQILDHRGGCLTSR
ncbi:hypothetical protein NLU13_5147 [Sarocladium strictum]|uniref:Nucleotide-diphospho-sugar transferase domain-containing protein n=1 Tax=Sarocladium strictum TaxID=5046 RepID=A0AA39GH30_SARSR|nr:hypothetical protein NLU13_5147 [Sarocladium strictum]